MSPSTDSPVAGSLPPWLDRLTDAALAALVAGTLLGLLAFVTNPVPDPSFPWATLPASLRLPVTQPRIEHWPVSYTLAIWLYVFAAPFVFLAGYRRYAGRTRVSEWLTAFPVVAMFGFTTYCRFFWPKLSPASWNAPSYTLVCWAYCSSYVPFWSNLAYAVAGFGAVATYLAYRDSPLATPALAVFGVAAFPLGVPALYAAYRRYEGRDDGSRDVATA